MAQEIKDRFKLAEKFAQARNNDASSNQATHDDDQTVIAKAPDFTSSANSKKNTDPDNATIWPAPKAETQPNTANGTVTAKHEQPKNSQKKQPLLWLALILPAAGLAYWLMTPSNPVPTTKPSVLENTQATAPIQPDISSAVKATPPLSATPTPEIQPAVEKNTAAQLAEIATIAAPAAGNLNEVKTNSEPPAKQAIANKTPEKRNSQESNTTKKPVEKSNRNTSEQAVKAKYEAERQAAQQAAAERQARAEAERQAAEKQRLLEEQRAQERKQAEKQHAEKQANQHTTQQTTPEKKTPEKKNKAVDDCICPICCLK